MSQESSWSGKHLIGGQWAADSDQTFQALNPSTGEPLAGSFHHATQQEVDQAFAAATEAQAEVHELSRDRISGLLDQIADQIMALGDPLLARAHLETALPIEPRLLGERARTVGQLKLFAMLVREGSWVDAVIDVPDPQRKPLPKPDVRRMLRPIGPVVVFGPGNFPLAFGVCGGDTVSALAAGNPVLVKGHSSHPGTNELFARAVSAALDQCRLPKGLVSLLHGAGRQVGSALVAHPACQAVGFTGSERAGRALFDLASRRPRPIPVYAEMGSLNPLVVLPGAIEEQAGSIAEGLAGSVTLGAGQFCTKPGLVLLLDDSGADRFVDQLAEQMIATPTFTLLGSDIRDSFDQSTDGFTKVAGTKVRVAGSRGGHANADAALFEVDGGSWLREPALGREAFGPAAIVIRCAGLDQMIAVIDAVGGSLTATVHAGTGDAPQVVKRISRALERIAGRVIFNGYPTGVEVCHGMVHGGPYPATTFATHTSVGTSAIRRFARPVSFQNLPDGLLPPALRNDNPLGILRTIDGQSTREPAAVPV